jgi:hypothetical protein
VRLVAIVDSTPMLWFGADESDDIEVELAARQEALRSAVEALLCRPLLPGTR